MGHDWGHFSGDIVSLQIRGNNKKSLRVTSLQIFNADLICINLFILGEKLKILGDIRGTYNNIGEIFSGHDVPRKNIFEGHQLIFVGQCPVSLPYFEGCYFRDNFQLVSVVKMKYDVEKEDENIFAV